MADEDGNSYSIHETELTPNYFIQMKLVTGKFADYKKGYSYKELGLSFKDKSEKEFKLDNKVPGTLFTSDNNKASVFKGHYKGVTIEFMLHCDHDLAEVDKDVFEAMMASIVIEDIK